MSYSFNRPCLTCSKVTECLDAEIIAGAISTIHSLNNYVCLELPRQFNAHKGSGSVDLNCTNYDSNKSSK